MYGFPLTIYLLSGWLRAATRAWTGWRTTPATCLRCCSAGRRIRISGHFICCPSPLFGGGFWLLAAAWKVLYAAQRTPALAATGPYARIRHPQYAAFVLILFGFFVQWPTLLTLPMFPVLVYMYARLARREEREVGAEFGGVPPLRGAHASVSPAAAAAGGRNGAEVAAATEDQATGAIPTIAKEKR